MSNYGFTINCEGNSLSKIKEIEAQLASMGVKAKIETRRTEEAFVQMGTGIKSIFGDLKTLIAGGLGIGLLMEGFAFIKESTQYFDVVEASAAKIQSVLASTGGIAGQTAEHLKEMAGALEDKTMFDDTEIADAQSMLMTFTAIRGEIFDKTIPAIADFATRFKMDLPDAANTLGKALNDPLTGMTKLQRQGVVFSESQKATIESFVKTGQTAKAQQVILSELSMEFGGLAESMGKTDAGKLVIAGNKWDNMKITIGEIVSKLQVGLIPVLDVITGALDGLVNLFQSTSASASNFRTALLLVASAVGLYYAAIGIAEVKTILLAAKTAILTWWTGMSTTAIILNTLATEGLSAAMTALSMAMAANPIAWIVGAFVALAAVVMYCWDKFKGFREFLGGMFGFFKQGVMALIHYWINFGKVIQDIFSGNFKQAWENGKNMIAQMKKDLTTGMADAIKSGADKAGKSEFKFGNLLKFGGKEEAGGAAGAAGGKSFSGGNPSGLKDAAINTSNLSGASGGLGQAKIINIKIDTMQKILTSDNKDLKAKGQDAVEIMLRTINNISTSQSSVQ